MRPVAVDQAAGDRRFGGVGDFGPDVRACAGELAERSGRAGDGDDWRAGLREGGGDPAPEAAARPDDDGGVV